MNPECEPWKGASVVVRHSAEDQERRFHTPDSGILELCDLRPGKYRIDTRIPKSEVEGREVEVGQQGQTLFFTLDWESPRVVVTTFAVEKVTKGPQVKQIEVRTWDNNGSCGFGPFERGKRYEVFATVGARGGIPPHELAKTSAYVVSLCSGTQVVGDVRSPPGGGRSR